MGTEDQNETTKKDMVVAVYRLLRNFCISFNTLDMIERNEDKQVLPTKFSAEITSVLGEPKFVDAVTRALKADKPEAALEQLPATVDKKVVKATLDFLEKHEKKEVITKLEAELETLTKQIEKMREDLKKKRDEQQKKEAAQKPPKAERKEKAKKEKKEQPQSTEERFRLLIKEVRDRVESIKFSKDDYKTYSDVQGELDSFMSEAVSDILKIKQSLKDRFQAIGKGGNRRANSQRRRSGSRKPRNAKETEKKEEGQQSVFSKAHQ